MARRRITYTFENVGTEWSVVGIPNQPRRYLIERARAEITDGSGSTVAIKVMEAEDGNVIDTVLEYDLQDNPLDFPEVDILFHSPTPNKDHKFLATTYIGVVCETGNDNTVRFSMDIEID